MKLLNKIFSKRYPVLFQIPVMALIVIPFIITACGDSSTNSTDNGTNTEPPPPDEPAATEVWMVGSSFSPSDREVEAGTTITWINKSTMIHTVTSGEGGSHDGQFDSGDISPDGTYTYTFSDPGTYEYFCRPHVGQGMTGTITVIED